MSFGNLRAMGAFLVSAKRRDGRLDSVSIRSEKGGGLKLVLPEPWDRYEAEGLGDAAVEEADGVVSIPFRPGMELNIRRK